MAILNQALVDGANVVARVVEHQVRQAVSDTITSMATPAPSPTDSSSLFTSPTTPIPQPPPTSTDNTDNNNNNQNNGTSSPLLFFVALGFGVVFTNLWIIVGVKYCFRYNARNRQMRALDENGDPINLDNMPARPHRRRREKKLMTMDEVNEKFPMMKYKTWVLERAREGLPTAGGVSMPQSRANSVRSVQGIVPIAEDSSLKEQQTTQRRPESSAGTQPAVNDNTKDADKNKPAAKAEDTDITSSTGAAGDVAQAQPATVVTPKDATNEGERRASDDTDEDDDDEPINAALPPEALAASGDTCAICIDTLEDDDDVRGLTCGHAFHAVCLDPWLTNRRACCPLCKADYYTPKPRPTPADGDPNDPTSPTGTDPARNNGRLNMPRNPQRALNSWNTFRAAPRIMIPSRLGGNLDGLASSPQPRMWGRPHTNRPQRRNTGGAQAESEGGNTFTRFRARFPPFRLNQMMRRNQQEQPSQTTGASSPVDTSPIATTPSQLEAGTRPAATSAN